MNGSYCFVSPVLGNGSGPSTDSILPRLLLDKVSPWRRKGALSLFALLNSVARREGLARHFAAQFANQRLTVGDPLAANLPCRFDLALREYVMGLTGTSPDYPADFLDAPRQGMPVEIFLLRQAKLFCKTHICAAGPLARCAAPLIRRRVFSDTQIWADQS